MIIIVDYNSKTVN